MEKTETPIKSRELSKAAPILRNNAPRIVSGLRLVPMDKVVTPITGTPYRKLSDPVPEEQPKTDSPQQPK